jgi:hypothetical protein
LWVGRYGTGDEGDVKVVLNGCERLRFEISVAP